MIKRKRYFWLMAVWLCLFCFSSYGAAGQAWDDVDVSETPAPYREIIQKANSMEALLTEEERTGSKGGRNRQQGLVPAGPLPLYHKG